MPTPNASCASDTGEEVKRERQLRAPHRGSAGGVVLTAGFMAVLIRPSWGAAAFILISFLPVLGWWPTTSPSNHRDWQPDVARLPTAAIDGSRLTVRNVGNVSYPRGCWRTVTLSISPTSSERSTPAWGSTS